MRCLALLCPGCGAAAQAGCRSVGRGQQGLHSAARKRRITAGDARGWQRPNHICCHRLQAAAAAGAEGVVRVLLQEGSSDVDHETLEGEEGSSQQSMATSRRTCPARVRFSSSSVCLCCRGHRPAPGGAGRVRACSDAAHVRRGCKPCHQEQEGHEVRQGGGFKTLPAAGESCLLTWTPACLPAALLPVPLLPVMQRWHWG